MRRVEPAMARIPSAAIQRERPRPIGEPWGELPRELAGELPGDLIEEAR